MKKSVFYSVFCAIFLCGAQSFSQKTEIYVRTGSTGFIERNVSTADSKFGGAYALFGASTSADFFRFAVKAKMKLGETNDIQSLSNSASWEKAWGAISLPIFPKMWIYGGHGFVLALPGSFYTITDSDYADGARWGKDGLALRFEGDFIQAGASFSFGTSSVLKEKLSLGAGINADFSIFGVPLLAGIGATYNNAKNFDTPKETNLVEKTAEDDSKVKIKETTTVYDYGSLFCDERDYTMSIFAQIKPSPAFSASAGYALNAVSMVNNSTYKRVEEIGNETSALNHSHIGSLNAKAKISSTTLEANSEFARAFDGDLWSIFVAVRAKKQIAQTSNWKFFAYPDARIFKIGGEGKMSMVLRPCATIEKRGHYFKFGAEIERREMKGNEVNWIWSIPAYYKFSL